MIAIVRRIEIGGECRFGFDRVVGCRCGANCARIGIFCGDKSEACGTECSSEIAIGWNVDGNVQRRRDGLEPVGRTRTAANRGDAIKLRTRGGKCVQAIAKRKSNAFKDSLRQGGPVAGMFKAMETNREWRNRSAAYVHRKGRGGR